MTIKEIEELSGMTRANIRFYEAEGLLTPERLANGYRDYSANDLEVLKRIRLLRTLRIPLEDIKALHSGEQELSAALDRHLEKMEHEKADIGQSQEICKIMQSDGAQYRTLDAQHYLDAIEQKTPLPFIGSDFIPEVRSPWRRYFARMLDYAVYSTVWNAFISLVMNVNLLTMGFWLTILNTAIILIIMLILEPLLLSKFGTTLGKWILGIHITDSEGGLLSYKKALERTKTVLWSGMGLELPGYSVYRLWKSYKDCSDGNQLDWCDESVIILKDEKIWRTVAYIGARVLIVGILVLTVAGARMPKNRGDITVAEFCENYNRLSSYYGVATSSYLNEYGHWDERADLGYIISIYNKPDYIFTETDGIMTGMSFSVEHTGTGIAATAYQEEMVMSVLSFVKAQKGSGLFSSEADNIVDIIYDSPFESFELSAYGVTVKCEVEYSGYMDTASMGILFMEEDAEASFSFSFSMQKQ